MQYQSSTDENERTTVAVVGSFGIRVVHDTNPDFDVIIRGLEDSSLTEEQFVNLAEPGNGIAAKFNEVSERVKYRDGNIYFDGDVVDTALSWHMLEKLKSGDSDWKNLVYFFEKLATNPSKKSRKQFYAFVLSHGLLIDETGDVVLYKGVTNEGFSTHSGYGIVDGKVIQHGYIPYEVGSVVEYPRSKVDDDRDTACSFGLHAGTYAYASNFASRLLTVTCNPRDIVSVPKDHGDAKVRTCRLFVKDIAPPVAYVGTSVDFSKTDEGVEGVEGVEAKVCDDCDEPEDGCTCDDSNTCGDCGEDDSVCLCDDGEVLEYDEAETAFLVTDGNFNIGAFWVEQAQQWQLTRHNSNGQRKLTKAEFSEWISTDGNHSVALAEVADPAADVFVAVSADGITIGGVLFNDAFQLSHRVRGTRRIPADDVRQWLHSVSEVTYLM